MKIPVFEQAMVRSVLTFSGSSLSNSLGYALSLKIYIPSAEQIITREQLHSQKTTTFNIQAATSTFTKNSYRWRPQLLPLEVILPPEAPNDNADEYTLELQGVDRIFLIWPDWKWLSWKSTEYWNWREEWKWWGSWTRFQMHELHNVQSKTWFKFN